YGLLGSDTLSGGLGDDILYGGDQRDYLYGDAGFDQLYGEGANDMLDGGFDGVADLVSGGEGADEFILNYRLRITPTTTYPYYQQSYELIEGENLVDFDYGLGDRITKRVVAVIT